MTTPRISVIVQFLNSAQYLRDAMQSILWQTFKDWELVLVDGGSTDASLEIAKAYEKLFPERIRVLRYDGPETLGIFSSRIWGAREARGAILAHLDSDDEWHPRFLERQYSIYSTLFGFSPGMIYGPMFYWWEDPGRARDGYVQPVPAAGLYEPPDLVIDMLLDAYAKSPGNSSVMIAREIMVAAAELIGDAEEKVGDDQFLWSFVTLRFPVFINPEPLSRYRQWPGSVCAQAIASNDHRASRQRHLRWLLDYISTSYSGSDKQNLLDAVSLQLEQCKSI